MKDLASQTGPPPPPWVREDADTERSGGRASDEEAGAAETGEELALNRESGGLGSRFPRAALSFSVSQGCCRIV